MQRLDAEDWAALVSRLPFEDAGRLGLASKAVGEAVRRGQEAWAARAMREAVLLTVLYVSAAGALTAAYDQLDRVVVRSEPTSDGYRLSARGQPVAHVPRRMYVHEFPRFCERAAGLDAARLWRVESFQAFAPAVAATLPLGWVGVVREAPGVLAWLETRVATNVTTAGGHAVVPRDTWADLLQRHARLFVAMRTGTPRRQRGRRARRWTKVAPEKKGTPG